MRERDKKMKMFDNKFVILLAFLINFYCTSIKMRFFHIHGPFFSFSFFFVPNFHMRIFS